MPRASVSAFSFSAVEPTVPFSITIPFFVSTWILWASVALSLASSAFTFVVITESLMGWSLFTASAANAPPVASARHAAVAAINNFLPVIDRLTSVQDGG